MSTLARDEDSVLPGRAADDVCECTFDLLGDDGNCGEPERPRDISDRRRRIQAGVQFVVGTTKSTTSRLQCRQIPVQT